MFQNNMPISDLLIMQDLTLDFKVLCIVYHCYMNQLKYDSKVILTLQILMTLVLSVDWLLNQECNLP